MSDQSSPTSHNETILVTGANRGIGLEVVRSILGSQPNSVVFLGSRVLSDGERVAREVCTELKCDHKRVVAVQLDVTCQESVEKARELVAMRTGGCLDVLVNNAGVMPETELKPDTRTPPDLIRQTLFVNFERLVAVTEAFLPLLSRAKHPQLLSTSSGCGTRTLGRMSEEHRARLLDPALDVATLTKTMREIEEGLKSCEHPYHEIPTVAYGLSKMAVNCYTQILARRFHAMQINACSPGFCNTRMCANYEGDRTPKTPALGASVFCKVLFGPLGKGQSGVFFKEASKPGTVLEEAVARMESWVA